MGANHLASNLGLERIIISFFANCIFGAAVFVGLNSFEINIVLAALLTFLLIGAGTILLAKILPVELIGISKRKFWLSSGWLFLSLICLVAISRESIFMLDPAKTQYSLFPNDKWSVEHCCLTAYSESARLNTAGEKNIYDPLNYRERKVAGFNVDLYHYPPPFLLLPLAVQSISGGDFINLRMLWFSISLITLMTALCLLAYRLELKGRIRVIGMAPLIMCSLPVLSGLQMSNVQIMVISVSLIAMVLFQKNTPLGGAFLAMSSVAKIFPGILFFYLLVNKKFKQVVWTAAFAVVLFIIAFLVVGITPFQSFIEYELPRLSSGEAFSRPFSRVFAVARNMAPFGIPLKMGWIGIPGMTLEIGRIVSTIFLLIVLSLAIWSARRKHSRTEEVSIWISLLCLGSLVSPFAPANYILISVIILVCVNYEVFPAWLAITIWLLVCLPFYINREAHFLVQAIFHIPAQFIAIAIPGFVLYKAGAPIAEDKRIILPGSITAEVISDKTT